MKNIEALLNKYFEGETTCEEERELRRLFTESIVPDHLQIYCPMFAFMDAENTQYHQAVDKKKKRKSFRKTITYYIGGLAAGLLLLLGISGIYHHFTAISENFVIIDGKQYTDVELVRKEALSAFHDVSLSEDEVFATLFNE